MPFAPLPDNICKIKSVAVMASGTPVHVVQVEEAAVPVASKEGVDPGGGRNSMKFPPKKLVAAPESFTVKLVAPPVPDRL